MTGTEYKVPDPGLDFAEVLKDSNFRFISQRYNGDGTYELIVETDVLKIIHMKKMGFAGLKQGA